VERLEYGVLLRRPTLHGEGLKPAVLSVAVLLEGGLGVRQVQVRITELFTRPQDLTVGYRIELRSYGWNSEHPAAQKQVQLRRVQSDPARPVPDPVEREAANPIPRREVSAAPQGLELLGLTGLTESLETLESCELEWPSLL